MSDFASAVLGPAGIQTLYGSPSLGLPVVAADAGLGPALARAHRAVRNTGAASVNNAGIIDIPGATGAPSNLVVVEDRGDAGSLIQQIRSAARAGGLTLSLQVDPAAPWASSSELDPPDVWLDDHRALVEQLNAASSVAVLAGPGVVSARAVPGLHALAHALGAGVVNTWGAKGIFHWRSRHHWATIGLQEQDFQLGGLGDVDLVVVTGVDEREAPGWQWKRGPHVVVAPDALAAVAEQVRPRPMTSGMPPLRNRLAAATQAGWESASVPLAPSQVTLHYGRHLAGGGLVAAEAGTAGFWVARTFATTELGMVAVPPDRQPGWAVACVTVARLADPLRPALAVVDAIDEHSAALLEFAQRHGVSVGVEVWSEGGDPLPADQHQQRLSRLIAPSTGAASAASAASASASLGSASASVGTLATDPAQMAVFVGAAGLVTAWPPPPLGAT